MSSSGSVPKPKLEFGGIIGGQWKVLSELGSGGCGVVYRVERTTDGLQAALKAETVDEKYTQTLKAETHVMRRMQWSEHVCRLFMAGRLSPTANAVVMSLVGRSVSWLRRQCPNQRFSLSTAIRVSLVCLNAVEDLHSIGYIHRDVKASNFTIGVPPNQRKIHLLDFGFARSYLEWNQEGALVHRRARTKAPFMGTDRYCSLNVHNRLEQSRRDDLFSFLFMIVELVEGRLPWRNCSSKYLVETKAKHIPTLFKNCPRELWPTLDLVQALQYRSRPDYELIRSALHAVCLRRGYAITDPYDWERNGRHYDDIRDAEKAAERKEQRRRKKQMPTASSASDDSRQPTTEPLDRSASTARPIIEHTEQLEEFDNEHDDNEAPVVLSESH